MFVKMRLNKYLSVHGVCSRREADRLIESGSVTVNGERAVTGQQVSEQDLVEVCGEAVKECSPELFYAVYKPRGVVVTTDRSRGDPVLVDLVPAFPRVYAVGRLDKESEGLILMTNNGEAANRIQKARLYHEKEYEVTVDRPLTKDFLGRMAQGVYLEELDQTTRPCRVKKTGSKQFSIILTQGLNRQIRRMCAALGYRVISLRRIRVMNILLGDLPAGKYRVLSRHEIREMKEALGLLPAQDTGAVRYDTGK